VVRQEPDRLLTVSPLGKAQGGRLQGAPGMAPAIPRGELSSLGAPGRSPGETEFGAPSQAGARQAGPSQTVWRLQGV